MKPFWILLPLVLLAGCAALPAPQTITSHSSFPKADTLPPHWQLNGRLSLTQGETGWHGGMDWQEAAKHFQLRVSGPLGQGGFLLSGNDGGVLLIDAAQQTYHAPDAESLLSDVTGWELPVSGLRYWIRGIPDPSMQFEAQVDNSGRLASLSQAGWTIQYTRYHTIGTGRWPARLALAREDVSLRMVIDQWRFDPMAPPVAP